MQTLNPEGISSDKISKCKNLQGAEGACRGGKARTAAGAMCAGGRGERMDTLISGYRENRENLFQACGGDRAADRKGASGGFAQAVLAQGADAGMWGASSPGEMSMEEYKQYISQQIRHFPVHPSRRQENIYVVISEEGYEAMKNDPEYEAWVLNNLRSFYAQPGGYFGSGDKVYTDVYIGATKEECYAQTWRIPARTPRDRAEERRREAKIRLEKRLKKKRLQKQLRELAYRHQEYQRKLVKKLIEHRRELEEQNRRRYRKTEVKDKPDGSRVLEITTRQRYEIEKITERDILRVEQVLWDMQAEQERQRLELEKGYFCQFMHFC